MPKSLLVLAWILFAGTLPHAVLAQSGLPVPRVETIIRPACGSSYQSRMMRLMFADGPSRNASEYYPPFKANTIPYWSLSRRTSQQSPFGPDIPVCLPGTEPDAFQVTISGIRAGPDEADLTQTTNGCETCSGYNRSYEVPHGPLGPICLFTPEVSNPGGGCLPYGGAIIGIVMQVIDGKAVTGVSGIDRGEMPSLTLEQPLSSPFYGLDCRKDVVLRATTPSEENYCDFSGMTVKLSPRYKNRDSTPDWSFMEGVAPPPTLPQGVTSACGSIPPTPVATATGAPSGNALSASYTTFKGKVTKVSNSLKAALKKSKTAAPAASKSIPSPALKAGNDLEKALLSYFESVSAEIKKSTLKKIISRKNYGQIKEIIKSVSKGAPNAEYLASLNPDSLINIMRGINILRAPVPLNAPKISKTVSIINKSAINLAPPGYVDAASAAAHAMGIQSMAGKQCGSTLDSANEVDLASRPFDFCPNVTASLNGVAQQMLCEKDSAGYVERIRPIECSVDGKKLCATQSECLALSAALGLSGNPPVPTRSCDIAGRDFCSYMAQRANITEHASKPACGTTGFVQELKDMSIRLKNRPPPLDAPKGCQIDYPHFPGHDLAPFCARLSPISSSEYLDHIFDAWDDVKNGALGGIYGLFAGLNWTADAFGGAFQGDLPAWEESNPRREYHDNIPYSTLGPVDTQKIDWPLIEKNIVDPCLLSDQSVDLLHGLACLGRKTQLFYEVKQNRLTNYNGSGERTECIVCRHFASTFAAAAKVYLIRKGLAGQVTVDIGFNIIHMWATIAIEEDGQTYSYLYDILNDPFCMELTPMNVKSYRLPKLLFQR